MSARYGLLAAAIFGLTWVGLSAEETPTAATPTDATPAEATPAKAPEAGEISRLLQDLDDAEFVRRQEASQRLTEAGKTVFPELEKAAQEGSREVSGRALEILQRHYERGEDDTKQAAKAALERLAAGGNAGAAQRANNVLNPPPEPAVDPLGRFGALPIRAGNIQIQIAANNGNNVRRVQVRNINGKKEIELEENGKKTKVQDGANGGIEVEITQKVNGKETTEKIQAKDLAELKTKSPDAARIYEQYQQQGNGIQVQFGGGGQNGLPGNLPKEIAERMVQSIDNQIKQLEGQAANNPGLQRHIEALKERKKDFERRAGK
jgi:hypothetical protein